MNQGLDQLKLVWGALVGGVVLYTLLLFGLMTAGVLEVASLDPHIMPWVGAGVVVYMGAGLLLRRSMIAAIPPDLDDGARLAQYRLAILVPMALMESGGLVLVTLGMLTGTAYWVLAGGGAAALLMFLARPSRSELGV